MALSAFSYQQITEARYSLGANIGKYLAQRILNIADFVGCVGNCTTALYVVPSLTNFSPELFTFMSTCAVLFARCIGIDRSFHVQIDQYKEYLLASFEIDVGKEFTLYSQNRLNHELLRVCERVALERNTFFDCSMLDSESSSLTLSFMFETDPLIGRRIKQDFKTLLLAFWN